MNLEHLVPSSSWTEDADNHCLLIHLPGFKLQEVRLRADKYGHVIVSGERQEQDNKIIHFSQSFKIPENSDIEETSAQLEDEILYITIPKKIEPENQFPEIYQNHNSVPRKDQQPMSDDDDSDACNSCNEDRDNEKTEEKDKKEIKAKKEGNERNFLKCLSIRLKKNRTFVITAVLAFSIGVLVSHGFQSKSQVGKPQ